MKRNLYRIGMISAVCILLAACAGVPAPQGTASAPTDSAGGLCAQQKQGFSAAQHILNVGGDARFERKAAEDLSQFANRVSGESDRMVQAIDQLTSSLSALKDCRVMAAQKIGTRDVGAASFGEGMVSVEIEEAKATLGPLMLRETALRSALEQAVAANPALKGLVSENQGRRLEQPYVALNPAAIHLKPANDAPILAQLRKGQRVLNLPGETAPPGWVPLALNDGTGGYVEAQNLKPVQPNPVAIQAMVRRQQREIGQDPVMTALFATREILPRKREALSDFIAHSLSGTAGPLAFNGANDRTASP